MAAPTVSTKMPPQKTAQADPYTAPEAGFVHFRFDFDRLPGLSTQFFAYSPKSSGRVLNNDWMVSGANIAGFNSSRGAYWDTSGDGWMWLAASSKSSNRLTLRARPNGAVNKAYSKFSSMLWGTDEEVSVAFMIKTSAVAGDATTTSGELIKAGLVLTAAFDDHSGTTPTITDANQVAFVRDPRKDATRLYGLTSVAGTDTFFDTGVDLANSTKYLLQIKIGVDRVPKFYVNRVLVGTQPTAALTTAINLKPQLAMRVTGNMAAHGKVGVRYIEIKKRET